MTQRYLVTSALPYSNGRLHVGHIAGAYLPADTYVRYRRARGDDVRFVCGSDDNGVAALKTAREQGTTVEELTARFNARQAADFDGLGINFDIYGGTHQPGFVEIHEKISQDFFKVIHENGYFVKKTTKQLYDAQADQFLPDRFVKGKCYECGYEEAYGDQCEHCGNSMDPMKLINPVSTITGSTPEARETTHWYMQLPKLEGQLREWLESKRQQDGEEPAWRDTVLNFSLGQIKQGLPERAMTRDLSWGVPVPLDDPDAQGKMLYVWFDAPIGYVSFTARFCQDKDGDAAEYRKWWKDPDCRIVHFIGEDNTVFHALTWPAMLMAEGSYQLPWQVVANAFLNIKFPGKEEEKVSKSRGTAIWIEEYLKTFEPDPLRYYLTAIAPERQRTAFNVEDFFGSNNSILSNTLGNFVNRTLTFAHKYFEGKVPARSTESDADHKQLARISEIHERVTDHMEHFRFRDALDVAMDLARDGNAYFNEKEPWKQRKEDLAACGTTLNVCIQTVRALTTLLSPFLPFSARKCLKMLNLAEDALQWDQAGAQLAEGHELNEPEILFQRLDPAELLDDQA